MGDNKLRQVPLEEIAENRARCHDNEGGDAASGGLPDVARRRRAADRYARIAALPLCCVGPCPTKDIAEISVEAQQEAAAERRAAETQPLSAHARTRLIVGTTASLVGGLLTALLAAIYANNPNNYKLFATTLAACLWVGGVALLCARKERGE
ncbi:MAG: hypothetical protein WDA41_10805 [Candidatus Neomarinimicrobiota bacterium]